MLEYVERFRGTPLLNSPAADVMRVRLVGWQVQVNEKATPFQILRLFFNTLQRPGFLAACSRNERGTPTGSSPPACLSNPTALGGRATAETNLTKHSADFFNPLGKLKGA